MSKATINLDRGLGNQLFTFHAGLYLGLASNSKLVEFDITGIQSEKQQRASGIDDFEIQVSGAPFDIEWKKKHKSSFQNLAERSVHKVFKRTEITRRLMRQYRSITYGFDSKLGSLKTPIQIWGNYQSWRYPLALAEAGIGIHFGLKHPSAWYQDWCERARQICPIAIHMRRGDYASYASTLGLLTHKYYLGALMQVLDNNMQEGLDIWIYSDSLLAANELAREIKLISDRRVENCQVTVMSPPKESTSAENLLLLSMSQAIITSNSSWSWWASWIAGQKTRVIVPDPYYKAFHGEFIDHIPSYWQRYMSDFV